jgi:hypothetical protein
MIIGTKSRYWPLLFVATSLVSGIEVPARVASAEKDLCNSIETYVWP